MPKKKKQPTKKGRQKTHSKTNTVGIFFAFLVTFVTVAILGLTFTGTHSTPTASAIASPGKGPPTEIIKQVPPDKELVISIHYPKKAKPGTGGSASTLCPWKKLGTWNTKNIAYSEDNSNSGVDATTTHNAILAAFKSWSDISGLTNPIVTQKSGLPSTYVSETSNGENEIGWAPLGQKGYTNAIAVTYVWRTRGKNQIIEADMVFNTDNGFTWTQNNIADPNNAIGDPNHYDIQAIAAHEFGHFLGLDHVQELEQTMYPYSSKGEVKKRSLECGDTAGIQKLYGTN